MKIQELAELLYSKSDALEDGAEILVEHEDGFLYDFELQETEEAFDGFDTFTPAGLKIVIKKE